MTPVNLTLAAVAALAVGGGLRRRGSRSNGSQTLLIPELPLFKGIRERMKTRRITAPFAHAEALQELTEIFSEDEENEYKEELSKIMATWEGENPPPADNASDRERSRFSNLEDQYPAARMRAIVAALQAEMQAIPATGPSTEELIQRDWAEIRRKRTQEYLSSPLGKAMAKEGVQMARKIEATRAHAVARRTTLRLNEMAGQRMDNRFPQHRGWSDEKVGAMYDSILREVTQEHGARVREVTQEHGARVREEADLRLSAMSGLTSPRKRPVVQRRMTLQQMRAALGLPEPPQ